QPQNPPPQTWNPTGATTATSQPQNPPPQTWNPTGATTITSQPMNSSPTSLTKQTRIASSPAWLKAIAVVSTITAIGIGVFSYAQYQQLNQIKKQIERIRVQKQLLLPNVNKPSLSSEIQNLINVIKGGDSFLYLDLNKLMGQLENHESSFKKNINQLQSRVNELEDKNRSLHKENDSLQSRVYDLTKSTYVKFCNKTESKTINASFAFWDGEGLRSKGWWLVALGECKSVSMGQNYRGNVYVYGMYNKGERSWGSGYSSFCVDIINAFDIPNSDKNSCSGSSERRVTMSKFDVSPGTNDWPFKD
ncbi:DUF1036 domain-containing protein, partial [Argonema galeatum]|uniref:DUF1036 domain-containing protein n=1 Tax=Argonema galeatum TaxID=2942762 RepID=UPI002011190B